MVVRSFVVLALTATAAVAQTLPRTVDGKPDLQGIWQVDGRAAADLEALGRVPYQPWALEQKRANFASRAKAMWSMSMLRPMPIASVATR